MGFFIITRESTSKNIRLFLVMAMNFDVLSAERYSVRKFEQVPVEQEKLSLVPAAMLMVGRPAPDAVPAEFHHIRHPLEKLVFFEELPRT
jgi:nitroreductase